MRQYRLHCDHCGIRLHPASLILTYPPVVDNGHRICDECLGTGLLPLPECLQRDPILAWMEHDPFYVEPQRICDECLIHDPILHDPFFAEPQVIDTDDLAGGERGEPGPDLPF